MAEAQGSSALFSRDGKLSAHELVPMALQHVVAAVVGIITPAIIVATCRLPADQKPPLIQVSLVMSGLATLVRPPPCSLPSAASSVRCHLRIGSAKADPPHSRPSTTSPVHHAQAPRHQLDRHAARRSPQPRRSPPLATPGPRRASPRPCSCTACTSKSQSSCRPSARSS